MAINMSKRLTMDGSWDECFTPEPSQASGLPSTIRSNNIDAGLSATRNHFTPTSSLTSAPSLKTVQPHPDERTSLNAGTNSAALHIGLCQQAGFGSTYFGNLLSRRCAFSF